MKRRLIALAVGGLVFAGVYGLAATLAVDGGDLQAGGDTALSCDADGVAVAYVLVFNNTTNEYDVDQTTVSGIHANCMGRTIAVDLANTAGASISHVTGTVAGTSITLNGPNASAELVTDAEVAIHS